MSQYGKLAKNTIWFAIGEFGSKLITFFMVPLYTYVLTREDFGQVDIFNTTISLLIPFISLILPEAVLRFSLDKNEDKSEIITNAFLGIAFMFFLFFSISFNFIKVDFISNNKLIFYFLILFTIYKQLFSFFSKCIDKIKVYSFGGILQTVTVVCLNLYFLLILKIGFKGILNSMLISEFLTTCYYFYFTKAYSYINIKKLNIKKLKQMLKFSIPLIPNVLNWWIMNVSDRYILLYFIGYGAVGLYSVACKLPTIIAVINTIFYQSWQLAAIENYNSKNRDIFYTNIFKINMALMFIICSGLLMVLKIFMKFYVSNEFYISFKYVPLLLIATVFSSFSSFFGVGYLATKNTSKAFTTSLIGSVINIVINIMFIPLIGIQAATISTLLAYLLMWVVRVYTTKEYFEVSIDYKKLFIAIFILICQSYVVLKNRGYAFLYQLILFILIISLYYKDLKIIIVKLINYFNYRFKSLLCNKEKNIC